jgi:hypothetical protein
MSIEILDKGACKAAGHILTEPVLANARVFAQGIASAVVESASSILLELSEGIGIDEFIGQGQRAAGAGQCSITWVDETHVRVETLNSAGAGQSGTAWFMFFRVPRGNVVNTTV